MVIKILLWSNFTLLCNETQQDGLRFLEMLTGGTGYCEHTLCIHCEGCLITVGAYTSLCYNPVLHGMTWLYPAHSGLFPRWFLLSITKSTLCIQFRVYQSRRGHITLTVMGNSFNQHPQFVISGLLWHWTENESIITSGCSRRIMSN